MWGGGGGGGGGGGLAYRTALQPIQLQGLRIAAGKPSAIRADGGTAHVTGALSRDVDQAGGHTL